MAKFIFPEVVFLSEFWHIPVWPQTWKHDEKEAVKLFKAYNTSFWICFKVQVKALLNLVLAAGIVLYQEGARIWIDLQYNRGLLIKETSETFLSHSPMAQWSRFNPISNRITIPILDIIIVISVLPGYWCGLNRYYSSVFLLHVLFARLWD